MTKLDPSKENNPKHLMGKAVTDLSFIQHVFQRIMYYVKQKKLPWRVRWVKLIYPGLFYDPIKFICLAGSQMRKEISQNGLILQLFGTEVLEDALNACKEADIKVFLAYGTLLGCFREKRFIKGDDDIDLGLFESDASKLPLLSNAMPMKGYDINLHSDFMISFVSRKFPRLNVDFYINFKYKNDNISYCAGQGPRGSDNVLIFPFPSESFSALKEVDFMKSRVLIPEGTEGYLTSIYGKNWSIPVNTDGMQFFDKLQYICPNYVVVASKDYKNSDYILKLANVSTRYR